MTEIQCRHGHYFQLTSPDQVILPEGYVECPICNVDCWTGIARYVRLAKQLREGKQ